MTDYDFDLFVIGAGSGGARAARMSSEFGAKVAIAEEFRFGGTCVIRGCVPKKLFVYASHFNESFQDSAGFGWSVPSVSFDWSKLVAAKDEEITRLEGIYARNLGNANVEKFESRAEIVDAHTVRLIGLDKIVTAKTILVAVGASPFKPEIPGIEHAITSNEALDLKELPETVTVVGGGYIAVEFAGIFHGVGVPTKLLYRGDKILRGFDEDMRDGLMEELTLSGVDLHMNADPAEIVKLDEGFKVILKDGSEFKTGLVMYATGRVPHTKGLGLENAGVELGSKGQVIVDEYSKSSVDSIYAVGDVTDRANLTPVAIREGTCFAETVFNNNPIAVDHSVIPTAVFSQPEIGTVGLTEAEAREQYGEIDLYKAAFRPMKNTISGRQSKMRMKLIVDAKSNKVLGCHVLGPDAAEIIQSVGIAIRMGATKADFDATIALHPSAAEELVTMRQKWTPPEA